MEQIQDYSGYKGELFPEELKGKCEHLAKLLWSRQESRVSDSISAETKAAFKIAEKCIPNAEPKLSLEKLDFGQKIRLLGQGSYGKVLSANLDGYGELAVKQFIPRSKNWADIWKERDFLIHLQHHRIVKLLGSFFQDGVYFLFDRHLGSLIEKISLVDSQSRIRLSVQIMEAVEWIHSKNIIHNDIKPDNVFVNSNCNAVLGDFGSAVLLKNESDSVKMPYNISHPFYTDYEANANNIFSKSSDIFSTACLIFWLETERHLLKVPDASANYAEIILNGRPTKKPNGEICFEKMEQRVMLAKLGAVLRLMVLPRSERKTMTEILTGDPLKELLKQNHLTKESIDKGHLFTTEVALNLKEEGFSTLMQNATEMTSYSRAMTGIYYDGIFKTQQLERQVIEASIERDDAMTQTTPSLPTSENVSCQGNSANLGQPNTSVKNPNVAVEDPSKQALNQNQTETISLLPPVEVNGSSKDMMKFIIRTGLLKDFINSAVAKDPFVCNSIEKMIAEKYKINQILSTEKTMIPPESEQVHTEKPAPVAVPTPSTSTNPDFRKPDKMISQKEINLPKQNKKNKPTRDEFLSSGVGPANFTSTGKKESSKKGPPLHRSDSGQSLFSPPDFVFKRPEVPKKRALPAESKTADERKKRPRLSDSFVKGEIKKAVTEKISDNKRSSGKSDKILKKGNPNPQHIASSSKVEKIPKKGKKVNNNGSNFVKNDKSKGAKTNVKSGKTSEKKKQIFRCSICKKSRFSNLEDCKVHMAKCAKQHKLLIESSSGSDSE